MMVIPLPLPLNLNPTSTVETPSSSAASAFPIQQTRDNVAAEVDSGSRDLVFRSPLVVPNGFVSWEEQDSYLAPMISAIVVSCHVLRLSPETTFSAACLLHRYHANTRSNNGLTANDEEEDEVCLILVCCILLACKTEEEPRRLRDFINLSQMISWKRENPLFGCSKECHLLVWRKDPPPLDENYWSNKKQIVEMEQHVLRWLAFDIHVSHPHRAIAALVRNFALASRAFQLLNQVAIYSSKTLSIPVIPLAMAAIHLAIPAAVTSTAEEALANSFVGMEEMDQVWFQTAMECLAKTMARFDSSPKDASKETG